MFPLLNVADGYRSELWPSANTLPFARTRRKRLTILAYAYKVTHIQEIVRQLEEYKRALDSAIDALQGREGARKLTSGISDGRQRQIEAMRRYWAQKKAAAGNKRATTKSRVGGITPAGRKRLSESMRKRWAAKRAETTLSAFTTWSPIRTKVLVPMSGFTQLVCRCVVSFGLAR